METKRFWWGIVPQVITLVCLIVLAINSLRLKNEVEALKKENTELKKQLTSGTITTNNGIISYNNTYSNRKSSSME